MDSEANLRQNRKGVEGIDVLSYSFQLRDSSSSCVGLRVTPEMREVVGGSEEFNCEIVPTFQAILVNEPLLYRCDKLFAHILVLSRSLLDPISADGADQEEPDD